MDSFDNLKKWCGQTKLLGGRSSQANEIPILILGNKCDKDAKEVTNEEIRKY
jgi:GTPase SAR1 family protein